MTKQEQEEYDAAYLSWAEEQFDPDFPCGGHQEAAEYALYVMLNEGEK